MAEVAVGALGSIAGSKTAQWLGGGDAKQPDIGAQITTLVNGMNNTLNDYLNKAIGTSTDYTNKAINTQKQGLDTANNQLLQYLNQATQQAQKNSLYGLQQSQAFAQPMINAGNTALDSYMDSLGLSRPVVGSGALQQALTRQAQQQQALGYLGQAPTNPGQYKAPQLGDFTPTQEQVKQYLDSNTTLNPDTQQPFYTGFNGAITSGPGSWNPGDNFNTNHQYILDTATKYLQNQQYQDALKTAPQQYQSALQQYNDYQNQLAQVNQAGPTAMQQSILNAYNQGYFGGGK